LTLLQDFEAEELWGQKALGIFDWNTYSSLGLKYCGLKDF
jgi:hypothetical protein